MLISFPAVLETPEERNCFSEYYKKYHKELIWYANKYLNNYADAEDVAHDVFCIAADRWGELMKKDEVVVKRFLFLCVRNRAVSFLRRRSKIVFYEEVECVDQLVPSGSKEAPEFDAVVDEALLSEVKAAVRSLDQSTADVIWMYIEGYTVEEIALLFNEKPETIKKRLYRGKKRLGAVLGKRGGEA